jgi:hypothetical protein
MDEWNNEINYVDVDVDDVSKNIDFLKLKQIPPTFCFVHSNNDEHLSATQINWKALEGNIFPSISGNKCKELKVMKNFCVYMLEGKLDNYEEKC